MGEIFPAILKPLIKQGFSSHGGGEVRIHTCPEKYFGDGGKRGLGFPIPLKIPLMRPASRQPARVRHYHQGFERGGRYVGKIIHPLGVMYGLKVL